MNIGAWSSTSKRGASNKMSNLDRAIPPAGIIQANETVWLFHKPETPAETPAEVPKAEIIFFHGLQLGDYKNAFWKTWLARSDENVVWPKDWLGSIFPSARILAISYDSSARINDGQLDMYRLVENLVFDIIMDGRLNIGQNNCPIILVGHCLGGIVIKQFILCAEKLKAQKCQGDIRSSQKIDRFLKNIKGIFYYSTPHGGFNKEVDWTKQFRRAGPTSELLRLLLTNGNERERINDDFRKVRDNSNMRTYAIAENLPSKYLESTVIVVDEESGRRDIDSYYTVKANHFDVCRPENMVISAIFRNLQGFIEIILDEALQQCFENFQWTPNGAVGLDVIMKEVENKLLDNSGVGISGMVRKGKTVGIHGMGGKGKTTLAKMVFNKLNPKFEYSCFVPNIKLIGGDKKKEVWNSMHHWGKRVGGGGWSQVRGKRLLLVLDDVADDCDLEVVSSIRDGIGPIIHCIVTSRNAQLLTRNEVDCYEIPFLNKEDAKRLFKSYAFSTQGGAPTGVLEKHMDAILDKCDGLPLTLEVIGKYLKSIMGKNNIEGIWEDTLEALNDADDVADFDEKIWKKLRVSYDGLAEKEQQMFLDATTFFSEVGYFHNWSLQHAKAAWSVIHGKEKMRWQTLVDLSLVYHLEDDDKHIRVHEQLQSMGRKIAADGRKRWWEEYGGFDFLKSNDGVNDQQIHSLRLSSQRPWDEMIPRSCLGRLKKLEFLDMNNILHLAIEGAAENETLLSIGIRGLLRCLGFHTVKNDTLPMGNLVLLSCRGFRNFDPALCTRLAVLTLDLHDITELPRSFGQLRALKILYLEDYDGEILPDEFEHLVQLERLTFWRCKKLRTLPNTVGLLSRLDRLYVIECPGLSTFPTSIKRLSALKRLVVLGCDNLREVPEFCGQLSALEHLRFWGCGNLHSLPSPGSFARLAKLQYFHISFCRKIESLPFSREHLPGELRHLVIGVLALKTIPDCIQSLPSLKTLELISMCDRIELPLWLGGVFLDPDPSFERLIFHVQDGKFILQQERNSNCRREHYGAPMVE